MEHGIIIDGCNPSNWNSPAVVGSLLRGKVSAVNATIAIWEGFAETVDETATWHRRFREQDNLVHVRETADIQHAHETGRLGVILGWQNISPMENFPTRQTGVRHPG
ncbi:membrane dipeptidase [Nesterenkonia muleiensis]|uniref:membrane dipeptidase n=1 Tax=Nesterenkonia muleiensis TaxID=2282648 RepID=UPI000E75CA38|nr:membrane dipeptidase [Nesterenkonia muleiensis]